MLVWFAMMTIGMLVIGYVLREGARETDHGESVHRLQDPRDLPLRAVRDALRPPRPPTPAPARAGGHRHPPRRRRRRPRDPNGPRLVR